MNGPNDVGLCSGPSPYYPEQAEGEDPPVFFHELGPQNSRGFRALKVWLALRQVGRAGYERMIRDDVALARRLHERAAAHPELSSLPVLENVSGSAVSGVAWSSAAHDGSFACVEGTAARAEALH